MRADAFGPAAVTRLACATRAPFATPWRLDRRRAGQHRRGRSQALRAGLRDKAGAGIEPARPWQSLRGACCRIQHNGLLHARPALVRKLTPAGHARNPRYVLRPAAPARGIGLSTSPCPAAVKGMCGHGFAIATKVLVRRAARAVMVLAPPDRPIRPQGAPRLSPLSCSA